MSDKPRECKEHEYQCYKCGEGYAPLLVRDFPWAANAMEEASFLYGELRKVHGLLVAAKGSTLVPQDFDIEHIRKALEICGQSSKPSQGQQALELLPLLINLCEGGDAAFHVGDCSVENCPVEKAKALLQDGE